MPMILGESLPDITKEMLQTIYNMEPIPTVPNDLESFIAKLRDDYTLSQKSMEELKIIVSAGLEEAKHHVFVLLRIFISSPYDPIGYTHIINAFQKLQARNLLSVITPKNMTDIGRPDDFFTAIDCLSEGDYLNAENVELYLKPGSSLDKLSRIFHLLRSLPDEATPSAASRP